MDPRIAGIAALVGYLIGSISFARIVAGIVRPGHELSVTDIANKEAGVSEQMGFVSATTVSMHLGARFGFITVLLDMLKVAVPTLVFRLLYPDEHYLLVCATAAMIGHIWPIYYGFKGGRGLSAMWAGLFVIDLPGVLITWLIGVFLGLALRSIYLFYFAGLWLFPLWLWIRTHDWRYVLYGVVANLLCTVAMIPEARIIINHRKQGMKTSFKHDMHLTGMGRGFYKLGVRIGLVKDTS